VGEALPGRGDGRDRSAADLERVAMQVLLLMYHDEKALQQRPREDFGRLHGAFTAYVDALKKAGVLIGNNGLRPAAEARTVRKDAVLDGPFAETKEQLAGYFLLEVPTMDAALEWAKRVPTAAYGSVEVRPVWTV
jgi:hypothetical protein